MPNFTITLSTKTVAKLVIEVGHYNDNHGTSVTLKQWIPLHLQEIAIHEELNAEVSRVMREHEQQSDDSLGADIEAERDRLMNELDA